MNRFYTLIAITSLIGCTGAVTDLPRPIVTARDEARPEGALSQTPNRAEYADWANFRHESVLLVFADATGAAGPGVPEQELLDKARAVFWRRGNKKLIEGLSHGDDAQAATLRARAKNARYLCYVRFDEFKPDARDCRGKLISEVKGTINVRLAENGRTVLRRDFHETYPDLDAAFGFDGQASGDQRLAVVLDRVIAKVAEIFTREIDPPAKNAAPRR